MLHRSIAVPAPPGGPRRPGTRRLTTQGTSMDHHRPGAGEGPAPHHRVTPRGADATMQAPASGADGAGRRSSGGRLVKVALATAATLAATALQVRANARRAEREHPPRGRFVEAGGVRLHYLEGGQAGAPPVVLVHGNAVTAEDWIASGVFDLVAARRRVVAFDRPGYGYSERPRDRLWTAEAQAAVFAEAFAHLGIVRPVAVGHSWGALVAVALGLDHPEAVSGLVLMSGYHFPTARADVTIFSPPAVPVLGDVLRYTVSPWSGG
jgi:hypothetical protein